MLVIKTKQKKKTKFSNLEIIEINLQILEKILKKIIITLITMKIKILSMIKIII